MSGRECIDLIMAVWLCFTSASGCARECERRQPRHIGRNFPTRTRLMGHSTIKLHKPESRRASSFSFKFNIEPAIAELENDNSVEIFASGGLPEKAIMSGEAAALAASDLEVPREFSEHIIINEPMLNIAWQEYIDERMKHHYPPSPSPYWNKSEIRACQQTKVCAIAADSIHALTNLKQIVYLGGDSYNLHNLELKFKF